jgi:uncharacterized membrane protein (UPF0127 family)
MSEEKTKHKHPYSNLYKGIVMVFCVIALLVVGVHFIMNPTALRMSDRNSLSDTSKIRFEIVDTEAKRELGLGGRKDIPDNYAMLFVFPKADRYGFWMKGMEQPIDILWISDTGIILGIQNSVATSTYPDVFYPPKPVKYVLETKAGFAQQNNLSVGQQFPGLSQLPTASQ